MCPAKDLHQKIAAFHGRALADPHHRYPAWEHCYRFFNSRTREAIVAEKNAAALQLGFYSPAGECIAAPVFSCSAYTVHTGVVERLASPQFSELWEKEVGSDVSDARLVQPMLAAVAAVKEAYAPFGAATDTLASKAILGMLACLPACDRFFIDGFKQSGRQYSYLNGRFVERILQFCTDCGAELRSEQASIEAAGGMHYPLMKLADMYFWQIGYEEAARKEGREPDLPD